MADGEIDNFTMICGTCSFKIDFRKKLTKVTSKYNEHISDYLSEINDISGSSDNWDGSIFQGAHVLVSVECDKCQTRIDVSAFIQGETRVWHNNQIKPFYGSVTSISKNLQLLTTSLSLCFRHQTFSEEPSRTNNHHIDLEPVDTIIPKVFSSDQSDISLRIIAKTKMNNGYCYLGFDKTTGRILRPILTTKTDKCCWPPSYDFHLRESYRFSLVYHPVHQSHVVLDAKQPRTPYPHGFDDLLVKPIVPKCSTEPFDVEILGSLAKSDIADIFSGVQENQYLYKNDKTPSVGILRCKASDITIYHEKDHSKYTDKRKCKLVVPSDVYDFPFKAIDYDNIPPDKEALVILGLGRPFDKKGEFIPPRCYILVVGIFGLK